MTAHEKKVKDTPVAVFAEALRAAFADAGIRTPDDCAGFGRDVAACQIPMRTIPYHDFTVQGWREGALLPLPQAVAAMQALLRERLPMQKERIDALAELAAKAVHAQKEDVYQPTELSHAMWVMRERTGERFAAYANPLSPLAHRGKNKKPAETIATSVATSVRLPKGGMKLHGWTRGYVDMVPKYAQVMALQGAYERFCKGSNRGEWMDVTLGMIYDQALRDDADARWVSACQEGSLGAMIAAIRTRRGDTPKAFGAALGHIPVEQDPAAQATDLPWSGRVQAESV